MAHGPPVADPWSRLCTWLSQPVPSRISEHEAQASQCKELQQAAISTKKVSNFPGTTHVTTQFGQMPADKPILCTSS